MTLPDPTGKTVLILVGEFAGEEGICLGRAADGKRWAVSPKSADRIVEMEFEREFGLLLNPGQELGKN